MSGLDATRAPAFLPTDPAMRTYRQECPKQVQCRAMLQKEHRVITAREKIDNEDIVNHHEYHHEY